MSDTTKALRPQQTDNDDYGYFGRRFSYIQTIQIDNCPSYWTPEFDDWHTKKLVSNSFASSTHDQVCKRLLTILFGIKFFPKTNRAVYQGENEADEFNRVFMYGHPEIEDSEGMAHVGYRWIYSILAHCSPAVLEILDDPKHISRSGSLPRIGFGGFRYWSNQQVIRKNNPAYPVAIRYTNNKGETNQYKLHRSRVISVVDAPSPERAMNGVGLSAVARSRTFFEEAEHLSQMFSQWFGGAEAETAMVLTSDQIPNVGDGDMFLKNLMSTYYESQANRSNNKVGRLLLAELPSNSKLEKMNFRNLPEGYDAEKAIVRIMSGMAAAYGVDFSEIWSREREGFSSQTSTSKEKVMSKLAAWWMNEVATAIKKVVPSEVDFYIDEHNQTRFQMMVQNEMTLVSAQRERLTSLLTTTQMERKTMFQYGLLTSADFEMLELRDGRMPDGTDVLDLFFKADYKKILRLRDPFNYRDTIFEEIKSEVVFLRELRAKASNNEYVTKLTTAQAAYHELKKYHDETAITELVEDDTGGNRQDDPLTDYVDQVNMQKSITDDMRSRLIASLSKALENQYVDLHDGIDVGLRAYFSGGALLEALVEQARNDEDDPVVVAVITNYLDRRVVSLFDGGGTSTTIREPELSGDGLNGTSRQIAKNLGLLQGDYRENARALARDRAEFIIDYELFRAEQYGKWAKRGEATQKQWLRTTSIEPREDHLATVGEIVGIDDFFSNGLFWSGELPNCKCGIKLIS